jgi:large subunit ribosomal protein L31e
LTEKEKEKEASKSEEKTEELPEAKEEIDELLAEEKEETEVTPKEEAEEVESELEKEKEAKPPKRKPAEEEDEIVEERIYTVPLERAWIMPPRKRSPRAMRMLRSFMIKHMKLQARKQGEGEEEEEPKRLIISNEVNEKIWGKGVEKPPRKIRVRAAVDKEGDVTVYLAEGD